MISSAALSLLPINIVILLTIVALILACVLVYALYKKGDVRAAFSHGKTVFELEAKERKSERKSASR